MLNRLADRVRIRTYAESPLPPLRAADAVGPRGFFVGDEIQARIESALPDGVFKVLIENQPYRLRLPCDARAGDAVQLIVTAREPLLKFALAEQPSAPAQAARLSDTARFITALLAESEKLPVSALMPAVTTSSAPLLHGPPANSAALAAALRDALAESGMFYESHQAQWVNGERPLATLLNEPQARLPLLSAPASATMPARVADINGVAGSPELPVHRDALPIVRQQLDTLESRHVAWQGLIWPDQPVEWQISEPPPRATPHPDEPPWQTRLKLTFPGLREIDAALLIGKRGVTITLRAALAGTAELLATNRASLQQALQAAGVDPLGITINADATP